jgi:predicted RNase H-like HicB family nuclease
MTLTAVVQREENLFVAQCPELGVVSQGTSRVEAIANLREAVEGLLEVADDAEIGRRLREGATVSTLEVAA